jgi:hypothetical protein
MDAVDSKEFAAIVAPRADKTVLVFLRRSWYATPILFYFTPRPATWRVVTWLFFHDLATILVSHSFIESFVLSAWRLLP